MKKLLCAIERFQEDSFMTMLQEFTCLVGHANAIGRPDIAQLLFCGKLEQARAACREELANV